MAWQTRSWLVPVGLVAGWLCVGWSTGCGPPPAPVTAQPVEKEVVLSAPFEAVWSQAVEWFATHNIPIKNLDKDSGLIATEYALSMQDAGSVMLCPKSEAPAGGRVEQVDHRGNFNVIVRRHGPNETRVSVNAFFGCTANAYEYETIFSPDMRVTSRTRVDCPSTGALEARLLARLKKVPPSAPVSAAPPTAAPAAPAAPAAAGCTEDAQCRGGRVCRDGACTAPTCAKDVDCAEPLLCVQGACVAPSP